MKVQLSKLEMELMLEALRFLNHECRDTDCSSVQKLNSVREEIMEKIRDAYPDPASMRVRTGETISKSIRVRD